MIMISNFILNNQGTAVKENFTASVNSPRPLSGDIIELLHERRTGREVCFGVNEGMQEAWEEIRYHPIGIIHSPFHDISGMPIQPSGAKGIEGTIEVREDLTDGLRDLDGFSHIIVIYHFHKSQGYALRVTPFLDKTPRGVFATRAPRRPNPIGMSVVELVKIEGNVIHIENVDILDGTPLLDIKPYVPEFDTQRTPRIGWLSKKAGKARKTQSDQRFK